MSERCILAVRFTPAGSLSEVRKAVGGFLRYVQHRDLHAADKLPPSETPVSGLLKYIAYRDQASARAELFGPSGTLGSHERKAFAAFVGRSMEESRPNIYRGRDGQRLDRRRAVYRIVISPERAKGLDLRELTRAAVASLQTEADVSNLRWMAAIHRNTAHPHMHVVVAGMREEGEGFARVDLTKRRLATMKQALAAEIQRQRALRVPAPFLWRPGARISGATDDRASQVSPASLPMRRHERPHLVTWLRRLSPPPVSAMRSWAHRHHRPRLLVPASFRRLRIAAARYRDQMDRELELEMAGREREGWLR